MVVTFLSLQKIPKRAFDGYIENMLVVIIQGIKR